MLYLKINRQRNEPTTRKHGVKTIKSHYSVLNLLHKETQLPLWSMKVTQIIFKMSVATSEIGHCITIYSIVHAGWQHWFILTNIKNTQIHCVRNMQFLNARTGVHTVYRAIILSDNTHYSLPTDSNSQNFNMQYTMCLSMRGMCKPKADISSTFTNCSNIILPEVQQTWPHRPHS